MKNQKGHVLLIVVLVFAALAGFFLYQKQLKPTVPTQATQTPVDETVNPDLIGANWKTYSNLRVTFKYPENLYYADWQKDHPYFYNTQKDSEDAVKCKCTGKLALFDVTDVTSFQDSAKQNIQLNPQSDDPSSPNAKPFTDMQNRDWKILGPIYGLGGSQTNAEVKINNEVHQLQIHIYDEGIKTGKIGKDEQEQLSFIKKILNTINFASKVSDVLVPADSQTPTSGVCAEVSKDELVTVTFAADNIPQPRCIKVKSNQKLNISNNSSKSIIGKIGSYSINVSSGKAQVINSTFGAYLQTGVHNIVGVEIWLQN